MSIYLLTAPVHQMQQYYRLGVLDNCAHKWSSLLDCLSLKTKRSSEVQKLVVGSGHKELHRKRNSFNIVTKKIGSCCFLLTALLHAIYFVLSAWKSSFMLEKIVRRSRCFVAMGRAKKGPEPSKLLRHKNTHLDEGPLWVGASSPFSQGHPGSVELIEREVKGSFWIGGIHGDGHCMGERFAAMPETGFEKEILALLRRMESRRGALTLGSAKKRKSTNVSTTTRVLCARDDPELSQELRVGGFLGWGAMEARGGAEDTGDSSFLLIWSKQAWLKPCMSIHNHPKKHPAPAISPRPLIFQLGREPTMTTAVVSNILVTSENPRHLPDDGSGFQIVAEQDTFTSTVTDLMFEMQEILENREKDKPHIWTFRTSEESSSHWKEVFGHLDDME
ncbi:hypothetical protein CK203_045406 [Vitis vinifera]|uniref:Uncharacterized protein n=1 Tax=Vitis vinifera TaxID=29760 RepID=A0A438H9Q0_VITVI|nr:hypothetical protein CK203_045406 [Vitis vinifera]